ncbi:prepilin-type N-terminal cleavage/methylation domain-containing protein [Acidovorax sp. Leaf160]|uniref:prepilin-type N-terminal cleavage/methylation domain-containing protein n=1 Tax=Acidovorax sp. Leaf160 TaxID=1736280 RepID=UPI0006F65270|nr:prepilin-type N-terminal cleavage/methylation domain-containing protein [Acidovorax sp. Leaf160]KQR41395.1 general secretion pathway protein GspJ [Acidovorax sp. Leaf160]
MNTREPIHQRPGRPLAPFSRRAPRRRGHGFTLVELLVVISLLSLIMLALGSALRTAAQTETRVDARLQRSDDLRVAQTFLRSVLERVSGQKVAGLVEAGASQFFFLGQPQQMAWVGVMPGRYGVGGRYHFRLGVVDAADSGGALVLQYTPWVDAATPPNWAVAESYTLTTGVTGLAMQYEDARYEPPAWSAAWKEVDELPQRVVVSVQTEEGAWPELVVPLRVMPASDPRSSRPTFGGSR